MNNFVPIIFLATCCSKALSYSSIEGVILHQTIRKIACSYTLAAKVNDDIKVSSCLSFDPNSDGSEPWNDLQTNGEFKKIKKPTNQFFGEMACGIAAKTTIMGSTTKQIEMVLVWDMPNIYFSGKQKTYCRFYTNYFGSEAAGPKIAAYALEHYRNWEDSIDKWQEPIFDDK